MAGVAWLACRTMLEANSPRVRFGVWLAASLKFLIPFALLIGAGHRLSVRPLLTPAQSQEVFDVVRGGSSGLATAPFQAAKAPQAAAAREDFLMAVLSTVWVLGARLRVLRMVSELADDSPRVAKRRAGRQLPGRTRFPFTKHARGAD